IASGILGSDQLVATSVSTELSAMLTADHVNLLYSGGKFRIRSKFNTADQSQHIRILDSYKLDLQVTAAAHYMVNGNEYRFRSSAFRPGPAAFDRTDRDPSPRFVDRSA